MACLWWLGTRVPWGWPDDFKGWKGSGDGKFPELRSGFYQGARLKEPSMSDNIKQRKNLGEGRDSHQMAARLLKVSEFLRSKLHLLAEVYAAEEWSSNPMTEPIVQVGNGKFGAVQSSISSVNLGLVHLQHSFYFYVVSNAWWDKVGSMDAHSIGTMYYGLHMHDMHIGMHPHPSPLLLPWLVRMSTIVWVPTATFACPLKCHLLAIRMLCSSLVIRISMQCYGTMEYGLVLLLDNTWLLHLGCLAQHVCFYVLKTACASSLCNSIHALEEYCVFFVGHASPPGGWSGSYR